MKSAPVLFCILWASIIGLVLWLFDMAYGWFTPFWCWVTDYQTLVGAIIAGAMTLAGGSFAYFAATRQTDEAWRIESENRQIRRSAVASHFYDHILKANIVFNDQSVIQDLDKIITIIENNEPNENVIKRFSVFYNIVIPDRIAVHVNDRIYIGVKTSKLIDDCNKSIEYLRFLIDTSRNILSDESFEEMKERQMTNATKAKDHIIDSARKWDQLLRIVESEMELKSN